MADEVWEDNSSVEMNSVHRAEVRYLSRFVSCLVVAVAVFVFALAGASSQVTGVISVISAALLYVICFKEVNKGFKDAFGKGCSEATFRSAALLLSFFHAVWMAFTEGADAYSYVWVVALSYAVMYGVMFLWEHEIRENIHLLERGSLCAAETAPSDLKRRSVLNLCLLRPLDKAPEIAYASRQGDPARARNKRFIPACLAVSFICAVICGLINGFGAFLPALVAFVCICAGFSGDLSARMPYITAQHRIRSFGAAMCGFPSVSRLCDCNTFVVRDKDVFPDGSVSVTDVRFRPEFDASRSIEYLAALLSEANAPSASAVLRMITYNRSLLPAVSDLQVIPSAGIRAVIDGHTVMAGNRELMLAHNIPPLPQSREAAVRSSTKSLTYLAVDGKLTAMVLFQYRADPALADVLRKLHYDVTVAVDTVDYNITENLVRKAYRMDTLRVIVPDADERRFMARLSRKMEERPAKPALVTCQKNTAVFYGADRAKDISLRTLRALSVKRVGTVIGLALTVAASFFLPLTLTPFWVLGYHAVWLLPAFALGVEK